MQKNIKKKNKDDAIFQILLGQPFQISLYMPTSDFKWAFF